MSENAATVGLESKHMAQSNMSIPIEFKKQQGLHLIAHAIQSGHRIPVHTLSRTQRRNKNKQQKKAKKPTYQVKSPQQIQRKAYRTIKERELASESIEVVDSMNRPTPEYFRRKKQRQKERREERSLMIRAYKWELHSKFKDKVFERMWRIGRKQILEALGMSEKEFLLNLMKRVIKSRQQGYIIRGITLRTKTQLRKQKLKTQSKKEEFSSDVLGKDLKIIDYKKKKVWQARAKRRKERAERFTKANEYLKRKEQHQIVKSYKTLCKDENRVFFPKK